MLKNIIATLSVIFSCFSAFAEEVPKVIEINEAVLNGSLYQGKEPLFFKMLNNKIRSVDVFDAEDKKFAMGMMELVMDENTKVKHRYVNFPRNELMFFIKGGIKLVDDQGNLAEAGPGEMVLIPKGWTGTRIFTGDKVMSKFSVVYSDKKPEVH